MICSYQFKKGKLLAETMKKKYEVGHMTEGKIIGFVIWLMLGILFIGNGLFCFKAKKATGFWANAKTAPIEDIKSYNRAMGKLWCLYGGGLILLGIPILLENSIWILISVVGVIAESILLMAVYTLKIEKRYRKQRM